MPNVISSFQGEYRWLSNFWPVTIQKVGLAFPSVEHAYQAAKASNLTNVKLFTTGTAGEAKRRGRQIKTSPNWERDKAQVMSGLLRAKFAYGTKLADKLLATEDATLVEGNYWHDNFWGRCQCRRCQTKVGHNHLGHLLMEIREELKDGNP